MGMIRAVSVESKPMDDIETIRQRAIEKLHQEQLDRYDAQLEAYEVDKASAKHSVRMFCEQFGANHVAAWVLQAAEQLGQKL